MVRINNYHQAQFLCGVPNFRQCPEDTGIEVAFCGRSNAGKSSAINRITGQQKLARTSKTPGRTQHINFFSIDEQRRLVDLPGYGYAKVPIPVKRRWEAELSRYLQQRQCLAGLILVSDIRRQLTDTDEHLLRWMGDAGLPVHVLLTKADKMRPGVARQTLLTLQQRFQGTTTVSLQQFSSLKGTGLEEAWTVLDRWFRIAV